MTTEPTGRIKVSLDKRILNEFASKILNEERMEKVIGMRERANHLAPFSDTAFHCECDDRACEEVITMSTEMYERTHKKTKQFVVVPNHVRLDIEDVGMRLPAYVVVEKHFPYPKGHL
jgi:hypothetical protein